MVVSKCVYILGGVEPILEGYIDADMVSDLNSGKSTSGYVFTFVRGAISW